MTTATTSGNVLVCAFIIVVVLFVLQQQHHGNSNDYASQTLRKTEETPKNLDNQIKNLAPFDRASKNLEPGACREQYRDLWGIKHHGGWYICSDPDLLNFQQSNCIVYSYGLG